MEQKGPKVEARPPAVIDWLVRMLIPPAARETVVGDLWERYRSPLRYLWEAIKVLPYVVSGQIRRAANLPLFATEAFILFGCLGGFVTPNDPRAARIDAPSWEGAAIATVAALIGLVLRDAYRKAEQWNVQRGVFDIVMVVGCVLISQIVIAAAGSSPDWLLSPARALLFVISALPALFVLRLVLGLDGDLRLSGSRTPDLSAEGLAHDYRAFERRVRMRNLVFVAAGLFIIGTGAAFIWTFVNPPPMGYAFLAGHVLVVTYVVLMGAARPMPAATGLTAGLSHYRAELERQRRLFRFMWWWFLLPLFLGIAKQAIAPGIRGGETLRAGLGMAAALLLAVFIAMLNRDRARKFRAKLATLAQSVER